MEIPLTPTKDPTKKIFSDILASFGGEIFLFIFALTLGVLTARYLGADGKGKFNVIYYAAGLLSTVFSLRFQRSFTYYLSKNKGMLGEIISTSFLVGVVTILGIGLVTLAFPGFFDQIIFKGVSIDWSLFLLICSSVYLWDLLNALLAGMQHFKIRAIFMGGSYALKSFLIILAIGILQFDLHRLFLVMSAVETALYSLAILLILTRAKYLRISSAAFVGMLKYSIQSFPGMVSDLVTLRIDVFFVNYFAGASQVGIYTVAISMANMLLYIPTATRNVLMPYIASHANKEITPSLFRMLIILSVAASIVLIPLVWLAVIPLYGTQFVYSRILFLVLLPGSIFWGLFVLIGSDIEGRGLPWKVSSVSIISAVATVVLDIFLIPALGPLGAALVSSITYGLSMLMIVQRYLGIVGKDRRRSLIPTLEDVRLLVEIITRLVSRFRQSVPAPETD